MLELIFIRHGETDWNLGRRIMGDKPIPLNDTGKDQVACLSNYFKDVAIDVIYSSPVVRAAETAAILGKNFNVPVIEAEKLTEIDYGDWVGMTFEEAKKLPAFLDYFYCPSRSKAPKGESMQDVFHRIVGFVEKMRKEEEGKRIVAVSHADVIKVALSNYLTIPLDRMHRLRIDNGSYSILWFGDSRERVLAINALPSIDGFFERTSLYAKEFRFLSEEN